MAKKKDKKVSVAELKKQLEECQKLKDEYLACWQRERADFLNYKKDDVARVGELVGYANIDLILKFLRVIDNIYLAEIWIKKDEEITGIASIISQMKAFLKENEIEEIEALHKKFDPNFHDAFAEVESKEESGTIVEEVQKGYQYHGRVIRPAKVKVSKFKN